MFKALLLFLCCVAGGLPLARAHADNPHVVEPGETLAGIASLYRLDVDDLVALNALEDADYIRAGDSIVVDPPTIPYRIAPGDTLTLIAEAFGISLEALLVLNQVDDLDLIRAGDSVAIPLTAAAAGACGERGCGAHSVQPGETLSRIASTYGIGLDTLARWNGLVDPDRVLAGQLLRLERPTLAYRIAAGDSLSGIARAFGSDLGTLMQENGIANTARIFAGSEIRIPTESPVFSNILGESRDGRPISAYRLGSPGRAIVLVGGLHAGPEEESIETVHALLNHFSQGEDVLPAGIELIVVPIANPDGYALGSRLNAAGVDLNRNWPTADWVTDARHGDEAVSGGSAPLSEPETRALYAYLLGEPPAFVLSYHAYAALVEANGVPPAGTLAAAYAAAAGYGQVDEWPYYEITGQLLDALAEAGIPAADVELRDGDSDAIERNIRALVTVVDLVRLAR